MKHLEIIACQPRRWHLPYFTTRMWMKITAYLFLAGVITGILVGSWWNQMLANAIANR